MGEPNKKTLSAILVVLTFSISMYAAQKFDVRVIDRQNSNTRYTYVLPGYSNSNSNAKAS